MTTRGLRIPVATYRLQLNRQFGFSDALAITGYLHDLGITDLYSSPCFKARAGSQHGYDYQKLLEAVRSVSASRWRRFMARIWNGTKAALWLC